MKKEDPLKSLAVTTMVAAVIFFLAGSLTVARFEREGPEGWATTHCPSRDGVNPNQACVLRIARSGPLVAAPSAFAASSALGLASLIAAVVAWPGRRRLLAVSIAVYVLAWIALVSWNDWQGELRDARRHASVTVVPVPVSAP
jgi:hypothetical protein